MVERAIMTVTLTLPPELEQAFVAQARAKGISLDEWVREVLIARAGVGRGSSVPRQSRLWELRKGLTLGDVSIKELISEGRE
jgi:hypothetical protein